MWLVRSRRRDDPVPDRRQGNEWTPLTPEGLRAVSAAPQRAPIVDTRHLRGRPDTRASPDSAREAAGRTQHLAGRTREGGGLFPGLPGGCHPGARALRRVTPSPALAGRALPCRHHERVPRSVTSGVNTGRVPAGAGCLCAAPPLRRRAPFGFLSRDPET